MKFQTGDTVKAIGHPMIFTADKELKEDKEVEIGSTGVVIKCVESHIVDIYLVNFNGKQRYVFEFNLESI